jgi:hypothetical protein
VRVRVRKMWPVQPGWRRDDPQRPRRDHRNSAVIHHLDRRRAKPLDADRNSFDGFIDLRPDDPGEGDPRARRLAGGRLQNLEGMGLATAAGQVNG